MLLRELKRHGQSYPKQLIMTFVDISVENTAGSKRNELTFLELERGIIQELLVLKRAIHVTQRRNEMHVSQSVCRVIPPTIFIPPKEKSP